MRTFLFIASVVIINPYYQQPIPIGAGGFITQEDGFLILQEDGLSGIVQEFTPGGNLLQQDDFIIFQEDGTSTIQKED